MPDIDTQLREYFDHVVQRVEADDVLVERVGAEPVRPLRVRSPHRHVPSWVNGVVAAAVVLVVVGGTALLMSPANNDAPRGATPSTPTVVATVPPTTSATTVAPLAPPSTAVPERSPGLGSLTSSRDSNATISQGMLRRRFVSRS